MYTIIHEQSKKQSVPSQGQGIPHLSTHTERKKIPSSNHAMPYHTDHDGFEKEEEKDVYALTPPQQATS